MRASLSGGKPTLIPPLFGDSGDLVVLCPGGSRGVELRPRRSQDVRGSPQLQKGGLRALGEAWMTTSY